MKYIETWKMPVEKLMDMAQWSVVYDNVLSHLDFSFIFLVFSTRIYADAATAAAGKF